MVSVCIGFCLPIDGLLTVPSRYWSYGYAEVQMLLYRTKKKERQKVQKK